MAHNNTASVTIPMRVEFDGKFDRDKFGVAVSSPSVPGITWQLRVILNELFLTVHVLAGKQSNLRAQPKRDCVIKVGDKDIEAHRNILAHHSQTFYGEFIKEGTQGAKDGVVTIDEFDAEAVRAMVIYIYSGQVDSTALDEWGNELFRLAGIFKLLQVPREVR